MVQTDIVSRHALLSTVKRNLLLTKLCVFCFILAVLHMVLDASQGLYESVLVDAAFAAVIAFTYFLNLRGYHKTAKIFALSTLNALFVFFVSVLPPAVGIFLYFFPLMIASATLFEASEKVLRHIFSSLPLVSMMLLVFLDFDALPGFSFESPVSVEAFLAVNVFSTAVITIICVNFMLDLNVSSERELQQLAAEVHGKNIHLEKTNAELDRFLYSTSHDLRSPLSSIKGLVNIARMETADAKMQRYFDMMIDRVDKLDFFIKDIIDYSKNARTEVSMEPVDLRSLVAEVAENLKYTEGAGSIEFKTEVMVDHAVKLDRNRLSIVLNNLMSNAIKYHDPRKEKQWISVTITNSEQTCKVRVSDNGMGIDPEHHSKIFDMFYRGTIQSTGSGLGLYIVKETIAKMNGTIAVESVPGKGSSFLLTFPVASA